MLRCLAVFGFAVALSFGSALVADEPKQKEERKQKADDRKQKDPKPELLPAPKEAAPSVITITPWAPQSGTREIWQYYHVDSRGRFVPRVLYHPAGAFNLRTGEPYPWTTTRPTLWMPYVME
jgi:hypothetical protein